MADQKISELTNITGANLADADEFVVVDVSADQTKAVTRAEFFKDTPDITVDGSVISDGDMTTKGTFAVNRTAAGYGAVEIGGSSGGLIDLKAPASDDYDARIQYNAGSDLRIITLVPSEPIRLNVGGVTRLTANNTGAAVTGNLTATGTVTAGDVNITGPSPVLTLTDDDVVDGTEYTKIQNSSGATFITSRNGAGNGAIILSGQGGGSTDEYARFISSGNFGIGDTNPAEALSVTGNIAATGSVTAGAVTSGNTEINGNLDVLGTSPSIDIIETDVTDADTTRMVLASNIFRLQTVNNGTYVSEDYTITKNASGATKHRFNIAAVEKMHVDSVGVAVNGDLVVDGGSGNMQLKGSSYTDFSDYWGSGNNAAMFLPFGYLGSNGGFATSLFSNGYRNGAGGFTSMGINGQATASGIDLYPTGDISFRAGTPSGASIPVRMHLDSTGLGIGTTSPSAALDVVGTTELNGNVTVNNGSLSVQSATPSFYLVETDTSTYARAWIAGGTVYIDNQNTTGGIIHRTNNGKARQVIRANGDISFRDTAGTAEPFYWDASAERLGIGTTAPSAALDVQNDANCLELNRDAVNGTIATFKKQNTQVGSISVTTSATAFNTTSDYRLKENITPIQGAVDIVKAMQPVTYTFKSDGSWHDGFLAHELQELHPRAVLGEKDAMMDEEYEVTPAVYEDIIIPAVEAVAEVPAVYDAEGILVSEMVPAVEAEAARTEQQLVSEAVMGTRSVPDHQGVDYSKLTPILTAALQEALNKIEALETRLTALESA